jgi:exodeoxyribonuclease V beta subunit
VLDHRYDVQYVLYTLALHRLLQVRLPHYDYDHHMGGAVYVFMRGIDPAGGGVHLHRPARALIEALDALLQKDAA